MSTRLQQFLLAALAGGLGFVAPRTTAADPAPPHGGPPDLRAMADRIVRENAFVKERDLVLVEGEVRTLDLVEELSLAVSRAGGSSLQHVTRDRAERRYYDEVPAKYDVRRGAFDVQLAPILDAYVIVETEFSPDLLAGVPAARLAATATAMHPLGRLLRQNGVRVVHVGNGLYPTDVAARRLGLTRAELEKLFWSALAVPAPELERIGDTVAAAIAAGKEVRVTHPNGTDLRFGVVDQRIFVNDGMIKEEQLDIDDNTTWLPAGEVYLAPVPGTASGKLVVAHQPVEDAFVDQITFAFEKGKVVRIDAKPSKAFSRFMERWEAAQQGKGELGVFEIGVNPAARVPGGKSVPSSIPAGNVTFFLGSNVWAGGEDDSAQVFGLASMVGATVEVDGQAIAEKGKLKVGKAAAVAAPLTPTLSPRAPRKGKGRRSPSPRTATARRPRRCAARASCCRSRSAGSR